MTPSKLIEKLAEVMAAVERIPKRGRNDFHKYDYAMEADIVEAIRKELATRKVMLLPAITNQTRTECGVTNSGNQKILTELEFTFTFWDGETGESIDRRWLGCGIDTEDKGLYKAMTGGEKYFLLKTFLIPTGDDPEKDTENKDKAPKAAEGRAVQQARTGAAQPTARPSARPPLPNANKMPAPRPEPPPLNDSDIPF